METLVRLWRTLEACRWHEAVLAEWSERFASELELLRPHLRPTQELATTYPCPSGAGDGCPRQVHDRGGGVYEAVCGNLPVECDPVQLRKTDLVVYRLDRGAALAPHVARVCDRECLEPVSLEPFEELLPVGKLVRREGTALVVLGTPETAARRGAVLELKRRAQTDDAVVLVAGRWQDQRSPEGVVELALASPAEPEFWRAVKLLWPEKWAERFKDRDGIFEEVTLEIGTSAERHVVRLNGVHVHGFDHSDMKLARLLVLAAKRAFDRDPEGGGWLKKDPVLELDDKEETLGELRQTLLKDLPDDFARLSTEERRVLIGTSPRHIGCVRLALHPRNVHFDDSLRGLRLLGERQTDTREVAPARKKKAVRKSTKGASALRDHQAQARSCTVRMLETARKAGAPLPTTAELLRS